MRILIDATPLLLRSAGVKTYTYHWIQHLMQEAGNEQILTFPADSAAGRSGSRALDFRSRANGLTPGLLVSRQPAARAPADELDDTESGCVPSLEPGPESAKESTAHRHAVRPDLPPHARASHAGQHSRRRQSCAERPRASRRTDRDFREYAPGCGAVAGSRSRAHRSDLSGRGRSLLWSAAAARPSGPTPFTSGTIEPRKNVDTLLDAWSTMRFRARFRSGDRRPARLGVRKDHGAAGVASAGRALPGLCSRGRTARFGSRCSGVRISVALRRLRSAGRASHGRGRAGDHVQRFVAARS